MVTLQLLDGAAPASGPKPRGQPDQEALVATLGQIRDEVDACMRRGDSFWTVEDEVIEPSRLSDDQKSALWLYGWSFLSQNAQRAEAESHLHRLGASN